MKKVETDIEVKYQAGYLTPIEPVKGIFDIKRDNDLITRGSHFFCQGHSEAITIEKQSPDQRYCQECYKIVRSEK